MSGYPNGNWHTANGGGLPIRRPPTVDEALPYSPFTSIVPFSPDVIPFPVNEPPTPPTTLTPEQQAAGRKAVGILNEETRGPASTAHHLEHTLRELRNLLGDPREMTEFHFKPTAQLATPPPDSPSKSGDESSPTNRPKLSPFASMLLKQTEVHYQPVGSPVPQRSKPKPEAPRPQVSVVTRRPSQQTTPSQLNANAYAQNQSMAYSFSTPVHSSQGSQPRSGPAVVIKPSSAPKHEFRLIDNVSSSPDEAQPPALDHLAALRPEERVLAEQKIDRLQRLVAKYSEAKEELKSEYFEKISTMDADITAMTAEALKHLYDRVMSVNATKCFPSVPVETIIQIHALCDPLITASDQSSLFSDGEFSSWDSDIRTVDSGLKSARLALTTMLEGPSDRRTSSEDLLTTIVQVVKRVLDSCIFPVLEASRGAADSDLFAYASNHRDEITAILRLCSSVQDLLAKTVRKITLPDSALNAVEFLALSLFVHPNSPSEKESILGIQKFEALRLASMRVLTNIFGSRPDHQTYIVNEILRNLDKLPDKGPNTRLFKSVREEPIMTVSAIFMQFVQVAATNTSNHNSKSTSAPKEEDSEDEDKSESEYDSDRKPARKAKVPKNTASEEEATRRLMDNARQIAQRIANTLTERALNVTKSGDKPYRNLLDMFVDDFCKVLGSPEWPAANLLLFPLFTQMTKYLADTSNRNMALSILGTMGSGIIDFKKRIRLLKRDLDISQSELSSKLQQLTEDMLEGYDVRLRKNDLLALRDPNRVVIKSLPDYLGVNDDTEDLRLLSVRGCNISCWLDSITQAMEIKDDDDDNDVSNDRVIAELRREVRSMALEPKWACREYKFQNISPTETRLAAAITTWKSQFCQYYPGIVNIMFKQIRDGGAQQKNSAIKNIESFLGKDPHAVAEKHVNVLVEKLRDASPLVRAAVLSLISKCLASNPALERLCLQPVLLMTTDSNNEPKKRAINLLKTIYTRSESLDVKTQIVAALLPASQDLEKPVSDPARQALEEVWLKVLDPHTNADESRLRLQRVERVSLVVQTVRKINKLPTSMQAFEAFFSQALSKSAPNASINFRICKDLVADLVEGVISPDSIGAEYTQDSGLQTLSIFARVSPTMFTLDHIQRLKLYIIDPKTADDIEILRSTVTIYRFVIPCLSDLPTKFADDVWKLLSEAIAKLARSAANGNITGKNTLVGVVNCLWIMRHVATNGVAKLLALVGSILVQLLQVFAPSDDTSAQEAQKTRITSWLGIIGTFGKVGAWDEHADQFRSSVANSARKVLLKKPAAEQQLKGLLSPTGSTAPSSPSLILLNVVRPFSKQPWNLSIRETALGAVGDVCQGSPPLFRRSDVETTFKLVFKNEIPSLKQIALTQFCDFLAVAEGLSDVTTSDENAASAGKRLDQPTLETHGSHAIAIHLAGQFLQEISDVALQNDNELALVATRALVSINRQGLLHPVPVGLALIALGSSLNPQISSMAGNEHTSIHAKHESMFENEYAVAIKMAFRYQQDVFHDPHGMTKPPDCKPKVAYMFNVMKSSRKSQKKFLDNFCKLIDFKFSEFVDSTASSEALLFTRFCLENLALFDVQKVEDVSILITALEDIVLKNAGPSVGVAIETEMPKKNMSALQSAQLMQDASTDLDEPDENMQDDHVSITDERLEQITHACMILQLMWEARSFIRKAYNVKTDRILPKKFSDNAVRNNLIKGADLWEKFAQVFTALETRSSMIAQCYEFAELLEVDRDFQINGEEGEDEDGEGYATPAEDEGEGMAVPTSGRNRKRKSSATLANTPKKARGRPAGSKKKRNSKTPDGDDWD
ncbi:sister chromatid cohesion protein-like protein Mis4 [Bimuria novae-zelandiae CBS 107.79]|uniref:Sister chromatid cohesion protein n=1 Tax=Bimuria novae-zelandiae CBS 107.79 TaxID=1447943 RepID=A0A6A5V822_9PLEO|nr:sister chromatid cohesion protein-like protein Mis4 [Bimuria novae-zelandiae CBS 107.79]